MSRFSVPLTKRQKEILLGTILGDGYLHPASNTSARLKIEHGAKQRFYVWWKYREFQNVMQDKPKFIERYNPVFNKMYQYYRCQTLAMSELQEYRNFFYKEGKKCVPVELKRLFVSPLSLSVWYMDDGYYYRRDKTIYIYLPNYSLRELKLLQNILYDNFGIATHLYRKKRGYCFYVPVVETRKMLKLISKFLLDGFRYKTSS